MDAVEVVPDRAGFERVARALSAEATGREWRRDMSRGMEAALAPGVAAAKSALLSAGGGGHEGAPLLPAVAAQVAVAPLSSGAVIYAGKNGIPRGFKNAAKRFNQRGGFRRRVYGSDTWVVQSGAPGWFDNTLTRMHPKLRASALEVLAGRARRISRKA